MNRCALTIRMLMILRARGTKYPVSTRVLAQELETNPRNIREFKKELVTAGFNIIEKKGPYGGYMLDEEQLMPVTRLTEEEMAVYKRGRNSKSGSVAKNASMMDYRKATGVEALVGYLYLAGDMDRIIELIGIGFDLNKKEETGEEHES